MMLLQVPSSGSPFFSPSQFLFQFRFSASSFLTHQTGEGPWIFPARERIPGVKELPVIACTLTPGEQPERRRRWLALTDRALTERTSTADGVRLVFSGAPGVQEELRALAELERDCCAFASFDVTASEGRVTLDVTSSGDGVAAVHELFA